MSEENQKNIGNEQAAGAAASAGAGAEAISTLRKWQEEQEARQVRVMGSALLQAMLEFSEVKKPAKVKRQVPDDAQILAIAEVVYTAHVKQQEIDEEDYEGISWEYLDKDARDSWCEKVRFILSRERLSSDYVASEAHDRWLEKHIAAGDKKGSPFLRPWSRLTRAQKSRAILIVEVVGALAYGMKPSLDPELDSPEE